MSKLSACLKMPNKTAQCPNNNMLCVASSKGDICIAFGSAPTTTASSPATTPPTTKAPSPVPVTVPVITTSATVPVVVPQSKEKYLVD
ncbi:unnamed protein product [Anisakis simplex]|uniref:Uncharacterized protein n=1 Tax=Anisakis simplex TaxID=6269 RepID=A0A3P6SLU5_ANISI|nr:unnamed protein product [Anisakis simplex]